MKRSDMINTLHDYLCGISSDFKEDYGTCEDILHLIEEAGMYPPHGKIYDPNLDMEIDLIHEWETEESPSQDSGDENE